MVRCSKCGDRIRRLSRNKWGCINCLWHGPSKRRRVTVQDLFASAVLTRAQQAIKQLFGGPRHDK